MSKNRIFSYINDDKNTMLVLYINKYLITRMVIEYTNQINL